MALLTPAQFATISSELRTVPLGLLDEVRKSEHGAAIRVDEASSKRGLGGGGGGGQEGGDLGGGGLGPDVMDLKMTKQKKASESLHRCLPDEAARLPSASAATTPLQPQPPPPPPAAATQTPSEWHVFLGELNVTERGGLDQLGASRKTHLR